MIIGMLIQTSPNNIAAHSIHANERTDERTGPRTGGPQKRDIQVHAQYERAPNIPADTARMCTHELRQPAHTFFSPENTPHHNTSNTNRRRAHGHHRRRIFTDAETSTHETHNTRSEITGRRIRKHYIIKTISYI